MDKSEKRQRAIRRRRIFIAACIVVLVACIAVIGVVVSAIIRSFDDDSFTSSQGSVSGDNSSTVSELEKAEAVTATVLNTGDLLMHDNVLWGAKTDSDYDFSAFFKEANKYIKSADFAVANLEVTLGGTAAGQYSGYPYFNSPDSLLDFLKADGFDLLLTSNNHCFDTGVNGLKRTVSQIKSSGMDFLGTKETEADPTYLIKDINGIKIGMVCYTYETGRDADGTKYINGIRVPSSSGALINSFSYSYINDFYSEAQSVITSMENAGADAVVFYMHWGNEYETAPNTWQKTIAQRLCNMGVDVIVGGHPHVIQPIELLYAEGGEHTTVCLYSMGNSISNQRIEEMGSDCPTGHTEDGVLFSYTFEKLPDGSVELSGVDIIPAWVNRYGNARDYDYTMYPLETANMADSYGLDSTTANKARASFERTKKIVAKGLTECQQALGCDIRFAE